MKVLIALMIPLVALSLKVKLTVYHSIWLDVGRFVGGGTPVDLGFDISVSTKTVYVKDDSLKLLERGKKNCSIITIPGLDPFEYQKKDKYYEEFKKSMVLSWKKSGSECSLYVFKYPSLFESYWKSGKNLSKLAKNLRNITIIAHSKGGLVARCALTDEKFRKNVKDVYFLGTPHFGSPFANVFWVDPKDFGKVFKVDEITADAMRLTLAMSYTIGYVSSVGSKELSWMNRNLPPFKNYPSVRFHFIAGMLSPDDVEASLKAIKIAFEKRAVEFSSQLLYMASLSELMGKGNDEFVPNDGMVPVKSALALGRLSGDKIVLYGYTHATLYKDSDLISKMMKGSSRLPLVEAMGFEPTASTLRR